LSYLQKTPRSLVNKGIVTILDITRLFSKILKTALKSYPGVTPNFGEREMADNFNFTQQRIEKLPIPEKDRKDYYDTEVSKWICRVSASGNKSFCVLKRMTTGKLQRVTLGKWPDMSVAIEVGQPVTQLPPHRSLRAELPHRALQNCSRCTRHLYNYNDS